MVKFETDMLNFSINDALSIHNQVTIQERDIQEEFNLHRDRLSNLEHQLGSALAKVSMC